MRLTPKQDAVLQFVLSTVREYGLPPTRQEIATHFGFKSSNSAQCHLRSLQSKGFVKLVHLNRGIQLVSP